MKYVKDITTGKVYVLCGSNITHCAAITEALCDKFGADFVSNKCNYPVLDKYIVENLEIVGGCCDYVSVEQLPEDLMESCLNLIKIYEREEQKENKTNEKE